jgi:hypothetical protein
MGEAAGRGFQTAAAPFALADAGVLTLWLQARAARGAATCTSLFGGTRT